MTRTYAYGAIYDTEETAEAPPARQVLLRVEGGVKPSQDNRRTRPDLLENRGSQTTPGNLEMINDRPTAQSATTGGL